MAESSEILRRLDEAPLSRTQMLGILLCLLLNALDGFDVLAISFASPGIAAEWGIDRAALGLVLSMELIGMAVGSVVLGGYADRVGRRPAILLCLAIMAAGMLAATFARNVEMLSGFRLFTGLGIGGMLACTNAMAAELANARTRSLAVGLMASGYPIGAIVGGSIAAKLLVGGDWRHVFLFGAGITALFLPLAWWLLPESVRYLFQRRPANALARANRLLVRMGQGAIAALPARAESGTKLPLAQLFAAPLARTTILLTLAYFCHIMTFYFIIKWVPKIVVDMGYPASQAAGVLVWANVGGLAGAVLLSVLSWRVPLRALLVIALVAATTMVALFGQGQQDLTGLALIAAIAGFFTNAGVVGMYALIAQSFPTEARGLGTGFVIGVGRGGAALGPIVAGLLFAMNLGLPLVALAMAGGSLIAAAALLALRRG
ncbi:MFS transporter [Sphingomonas sp. HT-1]|uniref:MFS transporter n=1 Tax=unclassified Sphingomonas TaxID=196159 RepID=UPI0002D8B8F0|nr:MULTISPECIES: MFS transporter [unclassified Sphingomonas]KTF70531.1 MFS transporter [Sphingomonas sp. WG]